MQDYQDNLPELRPTDLRGILKYVPQWRNHIFVIALDGSVVNEENFNNILLEIAVLRNLSIKIVIVFGIGDQLQRLATQRGLDISDSRGYGPTDQLTLDLGVEASGIVAHKIKMGLTQMGLDIAACNAVRATERGVIKGVDQLFTGKVARINEEMLEHFIAKEIVPIISPIAFTKEGTPLRLNSDLLASRVAIELNASKLIYLLPHKGLTYNGELRLNAPVDEVRQILETEPERIDEEVRSKAIYAVQTIDAGVPRAHLLDCRIYDGLLIEIFSKVGTGSMIHSNPYAQIRQATRKDVQPIFIITKNGVRDETLRARTREEIQSAIAQYFVYEVDESVIACFRISPTETPQLCEIGSVFVQAAYQSRNIGKTLIEYALKKASELGYEHVVALTTQAIPFFKKNCGFREGEFEDLPPSMQLKLSESGRNSRILLKDLIKTDSTEII